MKNERLVMQKYWMVFVILILGACTFSHDQEKHPKKHVDLLRVVDGDTIVVELENGSTESVRIIGIDAPETNGSDTSDCFADEATVALSEKLATQSITLIPQPGDNRDKFGRLLRYIEVDDQDVGLSMIAEGYAKNYPWFPHPRLDAYADVEKEARNEERGVWSEC